ncbi:MAG: hypothetical protein M3Y76_10435 [Chloroflexota bacterium]|nr:hypothetical protein [Chloroflexota bacterium]
MEYEQEVKLARCEVYFERRKNTSEWEIIGTPTPQLRLFLQQETPLPEFLYPYNAPSSRFTDETSVPPILPVTLPHLTSDYEALYDELHLVVQGFPPGRIERHFARLFGWLLQRFGRRVCIERYGLSLPIVPSLIHLFPRANLFISFVMAEPVPGQ